MRGEQHLGVLLIGDGGEESGVCGFNAASVAAPEIHFPGDVEADIVGIEARSVAGVIALGRPVVHPGPGAVGPLHLWILRAGGYSQQRFALQYGQAGDAQ